MYAGPNVYFSPYSFVAGPYVYVSPYGFVAGPYVYVSPYGIQAQWKSQLLRSVDFPALPAADGSCAVRMDTGRQTDKHACACAYTCTLTYTLVHRHAHIYTYKVHTYTSTYARMHTYMRACG